MESNGRKIELECPSCGWHQMEPSLVISTQCRSCGAHMDIRNGKPVSRPKYATRLASAGNPPVQHPTIAPAVAKKAVKGPGPGILRRLFVREPGKREINCYHCKRTFEVVSDAQSSQCSKCGGYISLKDYEIDTAWRRRIQTRGDVTILKGGYIIGVHVQSHHLTVLGKLAASVECSGTLRIRSHGKIIGNVQCRELRVERGAVVEFQGDVHADSAYIDGQMKAQLTCTGTITLEKKAHLQGLARAGGLVVKAGAKHTGLMEVIRPQVAG